MNQVFIKPDILKEVNFTAIDIKSKKFKYYKKAKEQLKYQYNLNDIKDIINTSNITSDYLKHMLDFDTTILYKSEGHGVNHNIRVCLFAYIISSNEDITARDFALIMEACKYHDIGRINDLEDASHGKRSADKLTFLDNKYTKEEINYIKTIITCHSLNDKEFNKVAIKNGIKDIERCKKMHEILKDSDGLDRVRLHYPYVNEKYIRTETAKRMIVFAHELFYNYETILKNN